MVKTPLIHPFFFSIFPILFILSHNITEVHASKAILPAAVLLSVTFLMLSLLKLILKERNKAGIVISIFLCIFFSYGHIYEAISSWRIGAFIIGRHRYLMALCASIFIFSIYAIIKTRKSLTNTTKILNMTAFFLILIPIVNILFVKLKIDELPSRGQIKPSGAVSNAYNRKDAPKDVYYIILDAYARADILKELYNFDNHEFLDYLESKGFYIATESRSNHALTFLSLASSLNMEYLNRFQDELGIESTERRILYEAIKNNKVMAFFKTRGYKFVHFSSGWDATNRNSSADLEFNHGYLDEFMTVFIQTTILEPFVRHLIERDSRKRILDTFASLSGSHKIKGKKFVFAHVLCPHPPFIFGANGEFVPETKLEMSGDVWAQKENYLNQLLFINKLVKGFIEEVLSMSQNPPIIILQADHGPWVSYGKMDETMSIFNAYYLPPGGEKLLYKTISPVNSFRLIFNFYFGLNYRLLEDRNYYSDCETPYSFIDVTDGLIRDHRGI